MQKEAALFKALSDPTRLRLMVILAVRGETCVCDLAAALDEPDFKVSRHLAVLRSAGMVEARREGTWMYYRLVRPRSGIEGRLQESLREGLADHQTVCADLERLDEAACRRADEERSAEATSVARAT